MDILHQKILLWRFVAPVTKRFCKNDLSYFLDQSLFGAFLTFQNASVDTKNSFLDFIMEVVEKIFEKYLKTVPRHLQREGSTTRLVVWYFPHIHLNPMPIIEDFPK